MNINNAETIKNFTHNYQAKRAEIENKYKKAIQREENKNKRKCEYELSWLLNNGKFESIASNYHYAVFIPNETSNFLGSLGSLFGMKAQKNPVLKHINDFISCNKRTEINMKENTYNEISRSLNKNDNDLLVCLNSCMVKDSLNDGSNKQDSRDCALTCYNSALIEYTNIVDQNKNAFI